MPIGYPFDGQYDGILNRLGMGVKEAGFNPGDIVGLTVWLDAADVATIIDDGGGNVSEWQDKSIEGNHALQGTGVDQPSTEIDTINGFNSISFDGENEFMRIPGFAGGTIAQPNTIYIVFEMPVLSVVRGKILDGSQNGGRHVFETRGDNEDKWELYAGGASIVRGGLGIANVPYIASIIYNEAFTEGYINGSFDFFGELSTNPLDGLMMATNFSTVEFFKLKIGEIIVKNGLSNTAERLAVEDYLAAKWGINLFSPDDLVGLKLWLDAADTDTIIEDDLSGFVSQWNDKSGEENHVVQTNGVNQPSTGLTTINGKNTIDFDTMSRYFLGSTANESIPLSSHTIFFVGHLNTPDEDLQCLFGWNDNNGVDNREVFCFKITSGFFRSVGNLANDFIISEDLQNRDMLVSINVNHGNTIITRLDGVEKSNLSANAINSTSSFLIGAELDSGSQAGNFLDMQVGEILMYNRDLSIDEVQKVEEYLVDKWNIITSFPSVFTDDFSSDFS